MTVEQTTHITPSIMQHPPLSRPPLNEARPPDPVPIATAVPQQGLPLAPIRWPRIFPGL